MLFVTSSSLVIITKAGREDIETLDVSITFVPLLLDEPSEFELGIDNLCENGSSG